MKIAVTVKEMEITMKILVVKFTQKILVSRKLGVLKMFKNISMNFTF